MIDIRVQAGDGGADASDFASSLVKMISKSTGASATESGSEHIFRRL